ncbi:MAG: hypothetical protein ACTH5E_09740, partial [Cellulosimicrobium funkei]
MSAAARTTTRRPARGPLAALGAAALVAGLAACATGAGTDDGATPDPARTTTEDRTHTVHDAASHRDVVTDLEAHAEAAPDGVTVAP